jgi:hypothetical protein
MNQLRIRARRPMPFVLVLVLASCLGGALSGCAESGAMARQPANANTQPRPLPPPGGPDFLFAPQDG